MLSQENIFEMLRKGEKVTLECKRASQKLSNSVWETYSAMANTYGGNILLGVDEVKTEKDWKKRYPITGLVDAEKLRAMAAVCHITVWMMWMSLHCGNTDRCL